MAARKFEKTGGRKIKINPFPRKRESGSRECAKFWLFAARRCRRLAESERQAALGGFVFFMLSRIRAIWTPAFAGEGLLLWERVCFCGSGLWFATPSMGGAKKMIPFPRKRESRSRECAKNRDGAYSESPIFELMNSKIGRKFSKASAGKESTLLANSIFLPRKTIISPPPLVLFFSKEEESTPSLL